MLVVVVLPNVICLQQLLGVAQYWYCETNDIKTGIFI